MYIGTYILRKSNNIGTHFQQKSSVRNSVQGAKLHAIQIFIGIIIGLLIPFVIDWMLFGTPTPCKTIQAFEDGSSIQSCEVRK